MFIFDSIHDLQPFLCSSSEDIWAYIENNLLAEFVVLMEQFEEVDTSSESISLSGILSNLETQLGLGLWPVCKDYW